MKNRKRSRILFKVVPLRIAFGHMTDDLDGVLGALREKRNMIHKWNIGFVMRNYRCKRELPHDFEGGGLVCGKVFWQVHLISQSFGMS